MAGARVVGVIGTGGAGKTTVCFLLALAACYGPREGAGSVVAVDADVTEAMLTKMLLGPWSGPDIVDLLAGRVDLDAALATPRPALSRGGAERATPPGLERLKVVPGAHSKVNEIRRVPPSKLRESLRAIRAKLEGQGADLVLVDFPPGDPHLAEFSEVLAEWIDAAVAVVPPSRRRLVATAAASRRLEDGGKPTVAVFLNRFKESEPFDETGTRWESLAETFFGRSPVVLPEDPELARLMTHDSIPLRLLPRLGPVRAVAEALQEFLKEVQAVDPGRDRQPATGEGGEGVETVDSELRWIFSGQPPSDTLASETAPRGTGHPPPRGASLQRVERRPPGPEPSDGGPGGSGLGSRLRERLTRLLGGTFEVRYPDGRVRRVRGSVIRSALQMAGVSGERLESYMEAGSVNLADLGDRELEAWRFALLASGLEPLDGW